MGDSESSAAELSSRLSEQEACVSELEKELSSLQTGFQKERANQNQQVCVMLGVGLGCMVIGCKTLCVN